MQATSKDGIRFQGFIDIEIVNHKEHYTKKVHNTITKGAKRFLLAQSANRMLTMSGSVRGDMVVSDSLIYQNPSDLTQQYMNSDFILTNILMNLGAQAQSSLTEDSTFAPIISATGDVDTSLVTGYANNQYNPAGNGKEGKVDYCKDEYVADGTVVCQRWKYPEGVATGTIDTIAMMPGGWKSGHKFGGVRVAKSLDKVSITNSNFVSRSTRFCVPGIAGFTSSNEILLNYEQDGISEHKYNMVTGEMTDNPGSFFLFPEGTYDVIKVGDYWYAIYKNGTSKTVAVYLASTMTQVTTFNVTRLSSGAATENFKFVYANNKLYVSAQVLAAGSTSSVSLLVQLTSNGTYYNGQGTSSQTYTDWSQLVTLPSGLNKNDVNFGMCGDNYVMYIKDPGYANASSNYQNVCYTAIIFDDLTDVMGSIVDIIPQVYNTSVIWSTGSDYGVLDTEYVVYTLSGTDYVYDLNTKSKAVSEGGTVYTTAVNHKLKGLYLTTRGDYTSLISFVKLQNAIQKTATDIMYVSYGYKVV